MIWSFSLIDKGTQYEIEGSAVEWTVKQPDTVSDQLVKKVEHLADKQPGIFVGDVESKNWKRVNVGLTFINLPVNLVFPACCSAPKWPKIKQMQLLDNKAHL